MNNGQKGLAFILTLFLIINFYPLHPLLESHAQPTKGKRDLTLLEPRLTSKLVKNDLPINRTTAMSGVMQAKPAFMSHTIIPDLRMVAIPSPGTNILVTPFSGLQNEPTLAVNPNVPPNNPEQLLAGANDYRSGESNCGFYSSINGGKTWASPGVGTLQGPFVTTGGVTLPAQGDPVIGFSSNGTAFYSCLAFTRSGPNLGTVFVSKTSNLGQSWSTAVPVRLPANNTEDDDKDWMAVDSGISSPFKNHIYVCWTEFSSNGGFIEFSRSTNFGTSYSSQSLMSISNSNQGCVIAVGYDGSVYLAWEDLSVSPGQILIRKSIDGGSSFSAPVKVADDYDIPSPLPNSQFRTNSLPDMVVRNNGEIDIVWSDYRFSSSQGADILLASSTNGGLTWGIVVVNSSDFTNTDQFFPSIDVSYEKSGQGSINGTVHVTFFDKSYDPSKNTLVGVTTASSDSIGLGPYTSKEISDVLWDPNTCSSPTFIGDYIGSAAIQTNHEIWTDCRNTSTTGEDIYTNLIPTSPSLNETFGISDKLTKTITKHFTASVDIGANVTLVFSSRPGIVNGTVYNDLDGNGAKDPSESGTSGVTITLYSYTTGQTVGTTTTDSNGQYTFSNVPAGGIAVLETIPAGNTNTQPAGGIPGAYYSSVSAGQTVAFDFGNQHGISASTIIDGTVYNDLDGNGAKDPSESGTSGVTITLYSYTTGQTVGTTTTDSNGQYTFSNVPAGGIAVLETIPAGNTNTQPAGGIPGAYYSSVSAGQTVAFDFGNQHGISASTIIDGTVYNDLDGNGAKDPSESGTSGVTITLYSYTTGQTVGTTTTDSNGQYTFSNVPAGGIAVLETIPAGNTNTQPAGGIPGAYYSSVSAGQTVAFDFGNQQ